ncbi:MAG TPA: hypothetical protein VHO47_00065 [Candidatus Babeliales bacterium]|nr:hypothetical protein [Candidatus Babeliales bacterium]
MKLRITFLILISFSQLQSNDVLGNSELNDSAIKKMMLTNKGRTIEIDGKLFTKVAGFGPTHSILQLNKKNDLREKRSQTIWFWVCQFVQTLLSKLHLYKKDDLNHNVQYLSFMIYQIKFSHHRNDNSWLQKIGDKKALLPLTKREINYSISSWLDYAGSGLMAETLKIYEKNTYDNAIYKQNAKIKMCRYIQSITMAAQKYFRVREKQYLRAQNWLNTENVKMLKPRAELIKEKAPCMHPLLQAAENAKRKKTVSHKSNKWGGTLRKNDTNLLAAIKKQEKSD